MKLRLPATSANLGPAFDAAALALDLWLTVEAEPASDFSLAATGRNAEACADATKSLVLLTYVNACESGGVEPRPLALRMDNGIPFGMGLGSSASARLAGLALAREFGPLAWSDDDLVAAAAAGEGHADNVSACWFGGLTLVATEGATLVRHVTLDPPAHWSAAVVVPRNPVATAKARGVLAPEVSRADAVFNLQRTALLACAFANADADLMREATRDTLHQPAREELCPLLPRLLPLAGAPGIVSVTLSGAGPSVLMLLDGNASHDKLERTIRERADEDVEVMFVALNARS